MRTLLPALCIILMLMAMLLPSSYAQQKDEYLNQVELDSVTIQMSRMNMPQTELGRNVSIIEGKQLSQLPVSSIDELLRYIPGIESQTRNGFGVQADFIIRGSTFNQVLVVVDGVRMNDPLTGHFNSYIPVTPAEIERIEVLRGPASSIFGADAVGGVINIVTKTFSQQQSASGGIIEARIGENNLRSVNAGGYLSKDRWDFSAGLQSNVSDGQELPTGINNYFKVHTFSASAGYELPDNWKLSGRFGYAYRDFSAQYFYTRSPLDFATEEVKNTWAQLHLARSDQKGFTEFNASFKQTSDVFEFNPDFPSVNEHTTRFFIFQYNRSFDLNEDWKLGYGVQADNRSIKSNDRGDHDDWHAGIYGILSYTGITNLSANLSLRGDYDENYDFEVSPQLNMSYALGKWILRGSVGRGIRAADYTERFISNNLPGPLTPGRNIGNPDLAAESSWTYEAGFDFYPASGMRIAATVFGRSSNDLIDYVITNSNLIPNNGNLEQDADYFYATNITSATTSGFETELWLSRSLGDHSSYTATLGYTFLNTNSPSGEVSKYIASHASSLFTTSLTVTLGRLDIGINGLYKARNEEIVQAINEELEPDYMVWNARAGFRVFGNIRVIAEVLNIFDEEYSDILGARMPRRWFSAGVSWGIN